MAKSMLDAIRAAEEEASAREAQAKQSALEAEEQAKKDAS